MLDGRRDEALRAIEKLNIPRAEAEKDILRVPEPQAGFEASALEGFLIIFRRQYRFRTFLALFVLGMVQLSGIDGVLYVGHHAHSLDDAANISPSTLRHFSRRLACQSRPRAF